VPAAHLQMSWVPSPSARLSASYRDVPVTSVTAMPGVCSNQITLGNPVVVSYGVHAGVNQGSFTPAPAVNPSQTTMPPTLPQGSFTPAPTTSPGHTGLSPSLAQLDLAALLSPSAARRGAGSTVLPLPSQAATDLATRRSFTPAPVVDPNTWNGTNCQVLSNISPPLGVDDKLSHSLTNFSVPSLDVGATAVPSSSPRGNPSPKAAGPPDQSPNNLDTIIVTGVDRFTHRPRCPSFSQTPVPVMLNVYWQRNVAFDEHGRAVRRLGGGDLTWGKKFLKDVLGVYHVGIEVHNIEYTFGNYRAPSSRAIGSALSGVCSHEPRRPGPHCVFKQAVPMGTTSIPAGQVEDICASLGDGEWARSSYNRIHHNCVDFSRTLASRLGVSDIPLWCYRGAMTAKLLGLGGEPPPQDESENVARFANELAGTNSASRNAFDVTKQLPPAKPNAEVLQLPKPRRSNMATEVSSLGAVDSLPGIAVAISPVSSPTAASAVQASVNGTPTTHADNSSTAPGMQLSSATAAVEQLSPVAASGLQVGRRVSVFQSMGQWALGSIIGKDAEGRYSISYEATLSTEVNVAAARIVPLPEVPREGTALAQAMHLDDGMRQYPQFKPLAHYQQQKQRLQQVQPQHQQQQPNMHGQMQPQMRQQQQHQQYQQQYQQQYHQQAGSRGCITTTSAYPRSTSSSTSAAQPIFAKSAPSVTSGAPAPSFRYSNSQSVVPPVPVSVSHWTPGRGWSNSVDDHHHATMDHRWSQLAAAHSAAPQRDLGATWRL